LRAKLAGELCGKEVGVLRIGTFALVSIHLAAQLRCQVSYNHYHHNILTLSYYVIGLSHYISKTKIKRNGQIQSHATKFFSFCVYLKAVRNKTRIAFVSLVTRAWDFTSLDCATSQCSGLATG
jgi:hypothetical protein